MAEKMSLIVFSGTVDKLMAVATLATGAAAMGLEVDIFLTFWGLYGFRKDQIAANTTFTAEFAHFAPAALAAMQTKGVAHWTQTLRAAKEIGDVHVRACSMTMELFGWTLGDLDPIVEDVTGVATFVETAKEGQITLFI